MAFILLLAIALVSLVGVETNTADVQKKQLQARQNALLGTLIALGELQKHAGIDAAITAKSEIVGAGSASQQLLGVFPASANSDAIDTSNPKAYQDTMYEQARDGVRWMVSSITKLENPAAQSILDLNPIGAPGTGTIPIQTSVDNDGNALNIQAGKIPATKGSFAWWVDDESQKAKINTPVSETLNDGTLRTTHSKFAPAANIALETVDADSSASVYTPAPLDSFSEEKASKILSLSDANLAFPYNGDENWFNNQQHYLTTTAMGLPVDVTHGRLKQDLSYYLETGLGLQDDDPLIRGHPGDTGYSGPSLGISNFTSDDIPRFGLMRSWKEIGASVEEFSSGGATSQAHTNQQHGVHPVILRAGIYASPYLEPDPATENEYALIQRGVTTNFYGRQVTVDQMIIRYAITPRITIWNPTTVPITDEWFLYQASYMLFGIYRAYNGVDSSAFVDNNNVRWAQLRDFSRSKQGLMYLSKPLENSDGVYIPFPEGGNSRNEGAALLYTFALRLDSPLLPGETRTFYPQNYGNVIRPYTKSDVANIRLNNVSDGNVMVSQPYTSHFFTMNSYGGNTGPLRFAVYAWQAGDQPVLNSPSPEYVRSYISLRAGQMQGGTTNNSLLSAACYRLLKVGNNDEPEILQEFFDANNDDGPGESGTNRASGISVLNCRWYENPDDGVDLEPGTSLQKIYTDPNRDSGNKNGHQIIMNYATQDPREDYDSIFTDKSTQFPLFAQYNPRARHIFPGSFEQQTLGTGSGIYDWDETKHGVRQTLYSEGRPDAAWFNDWFADSNQAAESYGSDYGSPGLYDLNQGANGMVYPLFDYPRESESVLSLGDFHSVNFSFYPWQPAYAFGNSRADPRIARASVINNVSTALDHPYINDATRGIDPGPNRYIDLSWLVNHSLWDRFFLSSLPYEDGSPFTGGSNYPNPRNHFSDSVAGMAPADGLDSAAQHTLIDGAFNVNTTSVDSWRHFLMANLNRRVPVENTNNGAESSPENEVAFPRTLYPYSAGVEAGDRDPSGGINIPQTKALFAANRSITGEEAHLLAQKIVEEIIQRGPFTSLGDFINRRLVDENDNRYGEWAGLSGTLQTALDRVTLEGDAINDHLYADPDLTFDSGDVPDYLIQEHVTGRPGDQLQSRLSGSPGELTQGDLLRSLGGLLTVRGDTFRIRAYGEYSDGLGQNVQSWCEATVQRVATMVEPNDSITLPDAEQFPFGRKFVITNFRWLDQDEI